MSQCALTRENFSKTDFWMSEDCQIYLLGNGSSGGPLASDTAVDMNGYCYWYEWSRWETKITEYWNTEITMNGNGAGQASEWFRVTQNDTTNTVRAATIIQRSDTYALKIDHLTTQDSDAVNIVSLVTWNGTAVWVNWSNTWFSTMKVTNDWVQTSGAVIAWFWLNPARTSEVIGAISHGWGSAFKAALEPWSTASWLFVQQKWTGWATYTSNAINVESRNVGWDVIKVRNLEAQTAGQLALLRQSNTWSTADCLHVLNKGIWINILSQSDWGNIHISAKTAWVEVFEVSDQWVAHFQRTFTPWATTGDQTINKPAGSVNIAGWDASITVTNNLVNNTSMVYAIVRSNDATCYVKNVTVATGSFTINVEPATNASVAISFIVFNK